jgi:pimeloyl-ACP methyl ester carboxylesterase
MLFEGARYIHLVRHPYAVIESFVRNRMQKLAGIETSDPYGLAEQAWLTLNANILRFLSAIDSERRFVLKYEDLVTDPENTTRNLCDFLDILYDAAMLRPYEGGRMTDGIHTHSFPIGDPAFLSHSDIDPKLAEAWRSVELPRGIGQATRDLAEKFGYTTAGERAASVAAMRETWIDVRGARLCICEWGPQEGSLVLCIHGILEHGAAWELVAQRLASRGFRVVAPDLRGHGRSDHAANGTYHLLDFLVDVDAVARYMARPFRLVGHSMGAAVAAMYAGSRPEQLHSLVLIEPPSSPVAGNGNMAELLAAQLDHLAKPQQHPVFADIAVAAQRIRSASPSLPSLVADHAAERLTEPCEGGVRWRWDPMLRTRAGLAFDGALVTRAIFQQMLAKVEAPAILVYGDGSGLGGEAARGGLEMAGARRVVLRGGHQLHFEDAEELARVIAGEGDSHQK